MNAPLFIFRRSILTIRDYEITCLCLAELVPSYAPNFEPRPRASSQLEGSNPLILTKFREQGLFPMLGTTKSNLFTFVTLQCESFPLILQSSSSLFALKRYSCVIPRRRYTYCNCSEEFCSALAVKRCHCS